MTERLNGPDAATRADLAVLGQQCPLTHCLTNVVAAQLSANVLLALGAAPVMVENAEEAACVAGLAGSVLANLGTLSAERDQALRLATAGAHTAGTPWVLDPVAVGSLEYRTKLARDLLESRPAIVRGNASEVLSLAGADGAVGKGVESLADSQDAIVTARQFAAAHDCVVAVSGVNDYVTDGERVVEIAGGHPMLTKVTGVGCALGASMAALLAVCETPLRAAVSASAVFAAAGARAAEQASAPGSFAVALLDALSEWCDGDSR